MNPTALPTAGSSPRLRGTLDYLACRWNNLGIIPALAGNTTCPRWRTSSTRDHPRACGEHSRDSALWRLMQGSSPRLRGTPASGYLAAAGDGIIPALAGNTSSRPHWTATRWDHPRACGEHSEGVVRLPSMMGSSPRLRGTLRVAQTRGGRIGIIPALAGNTLGRLLCLRRWRDHPRACGEHVGVDLQSACAQGSSPRLRGTRETDSNFNTKIGIIPALAGNTRIVDTTQSNHEDHPRACGEHSPRRLPTSSPLGSSPRLRGTRGGVGHGCSFLGIIPALAGNTSTTASTPSSRWDHPRACGEHCRP